MAKPTKRKVPGGPQRAGSRVTAKGTPPSQTGARAGNRYVPPEPIRINTSGPIVPVLMTAFFGVGAFVILVNYLGAIWTTNTWYLLGGLGLILAGIITATQLR